MDRDDDTLSDELLAQILYEEELSNIPLDPIPSDKHVGVDDTLPRRYPPRKEAVPLPNYFVAHPQPHQPRKRNKLPSEPQLQARPDHVGNMPVELYLTLAVPDLPHQLRERWLSGVASTKETNAMFFHTWLRDRNTEDGKVLSLVSQPVFDLYSPHDPAFAPAIAALACFRPGVLLEIIQRADFDMSRLLHFRSDSECVIAPSPCSLFEFVIICEGATDSPVRIDPRIANALASHRLFDPNHERPKRGTLFELALDRGSERALALLVEHTRFDARACSVEMPIRDHGRADCLGESESEKRLSKFRTKAYISLVTHRSFDPQVHLGDSTRRYFEEVLRRRLYNVAANIVVSPNFDGSTKVGCLDGTFFTSAVFHSYDSVQLRAALMYHAARDNTRGPELCMGGQLLYFLEKFPSLLRRYRSLAMTLLCAVNVSRHSRPKCEVRRGLSCPSPRGSLARGKKDHPEANDDANRLIRSIIFGEVDAKRPREGTYTEEMGMRREGELLERAKRECDLGNVADGASCGIMGRSVPPPINSFASLGRYNAGAIFKLVVLMDGADLVKEFFDDRRVWGF